jgi:hypothetical protein
MSEVLVADSSPDAVIVDLLGRVPFAGKRGFQWDTLAAADREFGRPW